MAFAVRGAPPQRDTPADEPKARRRRPSEARLWPQPRQAGPRSASAPRTTNSAFAVAHRGLSSERAENTLAAFQAARDAGFPGLEMDLRATSDGEVVVLHDATLDRTTDGAGGVASHPWSHVVRLRTRDGPVPRLADLVAALAGWRGLWNLEVKDPKALPGTLRLASGLGGRVLVSSMHPDVLLDALRLGPEVPRALIALGPVEPEDLAAARHADCRWLNADWEFLDAGAARLVRDAGLKLGAYTVNDPARARQAMAWGADCIITDSRSVLEAVKGPAAW